MHLKAYKCNFTRSDELGKWKQASLGGEVTIYNISFAKLPFPGGGELTSYAWRRQASLGGEIYKLRFSSLPGAATYKLRLWSSQATLGGDKLRLEVRSV